MKVEAARAVERASKLTARVCSVDEEEAASEEFMRWALGIGLRATFVRTLSDDGHAIWVLTLNTGRGELQASLADPRDWRAGVRAMGLEELL